jgi:predicted enzyme related to lactoylglutathione lyase
MLDNNSKEFYSALFPSWEFKPVHEEDGKKVHQYSFKRPDGLTGGIVQMPAEGAAPTQSMGAGFTNYYFVHDVDEVRLLPSS